MCSTYSSFSQSGTTRVITKDSVNKDSVRVHIKTAQSIAKDLILLKATKEENNLLKLNTQNLENQIVLKDSLITVKDNKISLYQLQVKGKDELIGIRESELKTANRKLRWSNGKLGILGGIAIGVGIFALIK